MPIKTPGYHLIADPGLYFSLGLILIVLLISLWEKLHIEKEILYATVRGFLQLFLMGYALLWIFALEQNWITPVILLAMISLAASIVKGRGKGIPEVFWMVGFSLLCATSVSLSLLILAGSIKATPTVLIPLGGMIIGNSMNGASLTLNRLKSEMELRRSEILVYLSLGASARQASHQIFHSTLKASLIPAIDTMKTLGVIFMPGMMAGLIIAGKSPLLAVRYQIIVMFMLLASAAITNILVLTLAYRKFFTAADQLKSI